MINQEFENTVKEIKTNDTVNLMKNFKQHYDTSCFEHCEHVAYMSFCVCKKLGFDYKSAARAGMLHDLFLYDWRTDYSRMFHRFDHPKLALKNASSIFDLNKKEKDAIVKHMWPITIKLPRYIESYIVSFADKYCAISELCSYYKTHFRLNVAYRYASVLLLFAIFSNLS